MGTMAPSLGDTISTAPADAGRRAQARAPRKANTLPPRRETIPLTITENGTAVKPGLDIEKNLLGQQVHLAVLLGLVRLDVGLIPVQALFNLKETEPVCSQRLIDDVLLEHVAGRIQRHRPL